MAYAVTNPATGETVRTYDTITDAELEAAIAAADEAHRTWSKSSTVEQRAAMIRRVAELHTERRQELAVVGAEGLVAIELGEDVLRLGVTRRREERVVAPEHRNANERGLRLVLVGLVQAEVVMVAPQRRAISDEPAVSFGSVALCLHARPAGLPVFISGGDAFDGQSGLLSVPTSATESPPSDFSVWNLLPHNPRPARTLVKTLKWAL